MSLAGIWRALRKVADVVVKLRQAGLLEKGKGPNIGKPQEPEKPAWPGDSSR